jgi:hypothetical protein
LSYRFGLGAALLGLDELGASPTAHERLRRALAAPEKVSASGG